MSNKSAVEDGVLIGMSLCVALQEDVMPVDEKDTIETLTEKYVKSAENYPENWPELTLASIRLAILKASIQEEDRSAILKLLDASADQLDS